MEYIFIYGMFRDSAKKLLGNTISCGRAYVKGRLYQVNEFYPGLIEDPKSSYKVWGEIYLINGDVLPQLDEFEGEEYIRRKIKTSTDIECWIYEFKNDISKYPLIKTGDWFLR
jgi:gamma-glutamylcyclotransferase (GGCT)/AIG2-like uncharacterized protein YtfP